MTAIRRTLTTLPLVFVMYFNISGGPFTTEGLVASVGPGMALLILLLVPIFWSLPETLIVGELASMLPEEGGYYRWVERAFGPFWAFQNAWWTWLYSLVDMAIYPLLFVEYLAYFIPALGVGGGGPAASSSLLRWAIALAVIWSATALNLRGARPVGRFAVAAGTLVLVPFLLLALAATPHISHAPWTPLTRNGGSALGSLGVGLSIALWNYIGWDNASTVGGEIVDAPRTYPRALALTLPLVSLGYLIPLSATLGASDWTLWREGGWPAIARLAGGAAGRPLAAWIGAAGMVSAVSLFGALLLVYSRIPLVVAEDGLLPKPIAATDARGTPRNAVLIAAALYSLFTLLPFRKLVVADVLLYSMALFLEFGALLRIRRVEPTLRGPFRIPLGWAGVCALALLPVLILAIVVGLELRDGEFGLPTLVSTAIAAALGPPLYHLARRVRN
ncbi:MAG: APC family permease [Gemmatimonadota bacterium]|nr:APC family permease [Gemmatimonadota bacterium]